MTDLKQLITWIRDFIRENRALSVSGAILFLGALPLYFYALGLGQLPDLSIADFTGVLIASFLTEILLGATIVGYLLFTGFATRKMVGAFYPATDAVGGSADNLLSVASTTRDYLIKGRFIVGVTVISLLVWLGVIAKPFDSWLAPRYPGIAECAYAISLVVATLLVLADWRRGWRCAKYVLFAGLAAAISFLCVLAAAYFAGVAGSVPAAHLPLASPSVPFHVMDVVLTYVVSHLLRDRLVATALVIAVLGAVAALVIARITQTRRRAVSLGVKPPAFFKNEAIRLLATKVSAIVTFVFCSSLMVLFFGVIVDASPIHGQPSVVLVGGSMLIMLNWIAFTARDWKTRIVLGCGTFVMVFVFIPLLSDNVDLFPRLVTKALGFGNLRAASVSLSGFQCSTLAPYGVDCDAKKDTSIGITNVNILNQLGSTVLIELQVRRRAAGAGVTKQAPATGSLSVEKKTAIVPQKSPSAPASEAGALLAKHGEFETLVMPADARTASRMAIMYPCDRLLLERLRATDPDKADTLACLRLSVPKEQLLGNSTNGPATYAGDFSQYIRPLASSTSASAVQ